MDIVENVEYGHCSICRLDALRFVYMRDFSQSGRMGCVGEWLGEGVGNKVRGVGEWVTKCGMDVDKGQMV